MIGPASFTIASVRLSGLTNASARRDSPLILKKRESMASSAKAFPISPHRCDRPAKASCQSETPPKGRPHPRNINSLSASVDFDRSRSKNAVRAEAWDRIETIESWVQGNSNESWRGQGNTSNQPAA